MTTAEVVLLALVVVPFAAGAIALAVGRQGKAPARVASVVVLAGLTTLGLAVLAVLAAATADGGAVGAHFATVVTGGPPISLTLHADGLAAAVAVAVAVVSLLVQVYSIGYLHADPRYASYAALVAVFTAAMLLVVLAGDLLVLYVGWEVMGVCSYFLIGHHWEEQVAQRAAVKAFLTTRVGDVLLLFGIFTLATSARSFAIGDVLSAFSSAGVAGDGGSPAPTVALLLVLGGAFGKSAQFPFHVWLPDAMAGPTPVSALIHAATMVAAGVYLVSRLWPLFAADPTALAVLGVVAAGTMLLSALAALAQTDVKRVLAWSTVSQLAVMFGALAVAAPAASTFHLLAHAAFKALLFLCAGVLMHLLGTADMRAMGGMHHRVPATFLATTVGLAALIGVPPTAGFFSKESVLSGGEEAVFAGEGPPSWVAWTVLAATTATVLLTAMYATRLELLVFFGRPHRLGILGHVSPGHHAAGHGSGMEPREAPAVMLVPVLLLTALTLVLGVLALPALLPAALSGAFPGPAGQVADLAPTLITTGVSLVVASVGALTAYGAWRHRPHRDPAAVLGLRRPLFAEAFLLDVVYDRLIVRPVHTLARLVVAADGSFLAGTVARTGSTAQAAGARLRLVQAGNVQRYLTLLLAGAVVLAVGGAVAA